MCNQVGNKTIRLLHVIMSIARIHYLDSINIFPWTVISKEHWEPNALKMIGSRNPIVQERCSKLCESNRSLMLHRSQSKLENSFSTSQNPFANIDFVLETAWKLCRAASRIKVRIWHDIGSGKDPDRDSMGSWSKSKSFSRSLKPW